MHLRQVARGRCRRAVIDWAAARGRNRSRIRPEGGTMVVETRLLERDWVIEKVDRRLRDAGEGRGGLLIVTGPAGIGRSRLARVVAERAAGCGFLVRAAQGHHFEEDVPYGVLRQLLDPSAPQDGPARAADGFAPLFGPGEPWTWPGAAC